MGCFFFFNLLTQRNPKLVTLQTAQWISKFRRNSFLYVYQVVESITCLLSLVHMHNQSYISHTINLSSYASQYNNFNCTLTVFHTQKKNVCQIRQQKKLINGSLGKYCRKPSSIAHINTYQCTHLQVNICCLICLYTHQQKVLGLGRFYVR